MFGVMCDSSEVRLYAELYHRLIFCRFAMEICLKFSRACTSQEYDFGAEIKRQCLVPDPVGLLDCVENKVTLPYLTSWVDCTNSLGQNVKTSADVINYRCKSVWEGKAVIPEVFYIKDCVIEKTGLPAKNVSAEVLGAYKECENSPNPPVQQAPLSNSGIKTAPIQQQQINTSGRQQAFQQPLVQPNTQAPRPAPQPMTQVPRPIQQQPYSQQFFALYPRAPLPVQQVPVLQQQQLQTPSYVPQQQMSNFPIYQQQMPTAAYTPQTQQISQQQLTFPIQQKIPTSINVPQTQQMSQQQLPVAYFPQTQQVSQYSAGPALNNPYQYQFQIRHPQYSIKM